jgi:hypothetical protein
VGALLVLTAADTKPKSSPSRVVPSVRWGALPKTFRDYLVAWGVFSVVNSSDMFLLLRVKSSGRSTSQAIF